MASCTSVISVTAPMSEKWILSSYKNWVLALVNCLISVVVSTKTYILSFGNSSTASNDLPLLPSTLSLKLDAVPFSR